MSIRIRRVRTRLTWIVGWVYGLPERPVPRLGGGGWRCIWRVAVAWLVLFVDERRYAVGLDVFVYLPLGERSV